MFDFVSKRLLQLSRKRAPEKTIARLTKEGQERSSIDEGYEESMLERHLRASGKYSSQYQPQNKR